MRKQPSGDQSSPRPSGESMLGSGMPKGAVGVEDVGNEVWVCVVGYGGEEGMQRSVEISERRVRRRKRGMAQRIVSIMR